MTADTEWRPRRALEIVAGTPRGAGLDRTARALARAIEISVRIDVPVNVLNMPGDASRRIWSYLDQHPGDPHIVVVTSPNVTTDYLTGFSPFDHDAYTPLATLHSEYLALVVRANSPLMTLADLAAKMRRDPASVTAAVATSRGNPNHIALARIARHAGARAAALDVRAFDSARNAIADVVANGCELACMSATSAVAELASGELRALAVTAPRRLAPPFDAVPTLLEQSIDCVIDAWRGIDGARGLTPDQIAFWDRITAAATACASWQSAIAEHHWSALYRNSAQLAAHLPGERAEMRASLAELGLLNAG